VMGEALPLEKLRTFLRDLTPEARALLLAEIERAEQRGEPIPAAEFLLRELRGEARPPDREADRAAMPARLFFAPLDPFVVDDGPERPHRGRVSRVCLDPIWNGSAAT
jgi:hypothetical protein